MLDAATATWEQVKAKIKSGVVAVMGIGALEQHGPHLPLSTDTMIASDVARRLADAVDGLLLPAVPFGDAWNNEGFPGTISLSPETVRAVIGDIGRGLQASGVRGLIIFNGHFGNREPVARAARELLVSHAFPVLYLDYPGLEKLAAEICESKPAGPTFYHADEVETSMILALQPDSVQMALARAEYPTFPATYGSEAIMLHTFCATGVFGDPTVASAEKGVALLKGVTAECLKLVIQFVKSLDGGPRRLGTGRS
jgi:creatinine amidohydrolase